MPIIYLLDIPCIDWVVYEKNQLGWRTHFYVHSSFEYHIITVFNYFVQAIRIIKVRRREHTNQAVLKSIQHIRDGEEFEYLISIIPWKIIIEKHTYKHL